GYGPYPPAQPLVHFRVKEGKTVGESGSLSRTDSRAKGRAARPATPSAFSRNPRDGSARAGENPVRRLLNRLASDVHSTKAARSARCAKPARARLSIETFEDRLIPSVTPIVIHGTADNDVIQFDAPVSGDVTVTVNGQVSTFSPSQASMKFEIDPQGGSNTVNILETQGDVDVDCQGGTDNITVGNDTSAGVYLVKGLVTVNGDGKTSVTVDDAGYHDASAGYGLDAQSFNWFGVNGSGLNFSNLANFAL